MKAVDRGRFYVEFSRKTGGVVESAPTKILEEPVLSTGRSRDQLEIQLEEYTHRLAEHVGNISRTGEGLRKTHKFAKRKLRELALPHPGLIDIEEGYYTGWFYVHDKGVILSAFRGTDTQAVGNYNTNASPYLQLDPADALKWNLLIQRTSLLPEQAQRLLSVPHEESHPLYGEARSMPVNTFESKARAYLDEFWTKARTLMEAKDDEGICELIRSNILQITILDRVAYKNQREVIKFLKERMNTIGITIMPLSEEGSLITYIGSDGKLVYRSIPLPKDKRRFFQRFRSSGEKPLTLQEFKKLYQKLVDPQSDLFE